MESVKVLLVGIGGYGENYIKEALEKPSECYSLVGVVDPFISKSPYKEEIEKRNIPIFSSPDAFFLKGGKADLTVISSPIHTHYGYIMTALENGSNVLCEKPVTISRERMNALMDKERETGLFVAVGYQLCFARDIQAIKKRIISGDFGKCRRMKALRMMRRGDKYYSRTGWAGKLSCHGEYVFDSPLSNACAHQVQVMLYLLGKDTESTGECSNVDGTLYKARPSIESFDSAAVKITTTENVPLYFYTSHSLDEKKIGPVMEMEFEKAVIKGSDDNFSIYWNDGRIEDLSLMNKGDRLEKFYASVEAVKNGTRPAVTLKSSIGHIGVVLDTEKLPVFLRYDAEYKKTEDGDGYYSISGLGEEFLSLYEKWALPNI